MQDCTPPIILCLKEAPCSPRLPHLTRGCPCPWNLRGHQPIAQALPQDHAPPTGSFPAKDATIPQQCRHRSPLHLSSPLSKAGSHYWGSQTRVMFPARPDSLQCMGIRLTNTPSPTKTRPFPMSTHAGRRPPPSLFPKSASSNLLSLKLK
jgi:hypothetical protein